MGEKSSRGKGSLWAQDIALTCCILLCCSPCSAQLGRVGELGEYFYFLVRIARGGGGAGLSRRWRWGRHIYLFFWKGQCDISGFPHSRVMSFSHVPHVGRQLGYAHRGTPLLNPAPGSTSHHTDTLQIGRKRHKAHVCLNISCHTAHVILAACNTAAFGLPPFKEIKHPDSLAVFIQTPSRQSLTLKLDIWNSQHLLNVALRWEPSCSGHPHHLSVSILCPLPGFLLFSQYNCSTGVWFTTFLSLIANKPLL